MIKKNRIDLKERLHMNDILNIQQRRLTIVTMIITLTIILIMVYCYWNIQQDDSYIFYQYAQNLAQGNGYVFNVGEKINATTSPLYTCLLAVAYLVFRFLPFITLPILGHIIGGISLFFICLLLMRSFKTDSSSHIPFFLPIIFLFSPLLPNAAGMEAFLALMLSMFCIYFYSQGKLHAAGLACSFAILARPDILILFFVIVSYHLLRTKKFPSVGVISIFLIPILIWLVFSLIYFGSIVPTTLAVKTSQVESGYWGTGYIFLKGFLEESIWNGNKIRSVAIVAILVSLIILAVKFRQWTIFRNPVYHLIFLWTIAYLIVYGLILNPPNYRWYYTPLSLGFAILIILPVEFLFRFISDRNLIRKGSLVFAVYLVLFLISLALPIKILMNPMHAKYDRYKASAEWLNAHAKTGSSVGADEIGVIGYYYKKGPIIDLLGLITPNVSDHVRKKDFDWPVRQYHPDFVIVNVPHRKMLEDFVDDEWFKREHTIQVLIKTNGNTVAIYKRRNF